jgi:hypothetical protein
VGEREKYWDDLRGNGANDAVVRGWRSQRGRRCEQHLVARLDRDGFGVESGVDLDHARSVAHRNIMSGVHCWRRPAVPHLGWHRAIRRLWARHLSAFAAGHDLRKGRSVFDGRHGNDCDRARLRGWGSPRAPHRNMRLGGQRGKRLHGYREGDKDAHQLLETFRHSVNNIPPDAQCYGRLPKFVSISLDKINDTRQTQIV